MKKRFLSILLMLAMILACFPAGAAASSADSISVYVTISDQGVLAADKNGEPMGYRAVTVSDSDGDGTISIFDAYDTAHDLYCDSEFMMSGSGLVGQLWGDHSGNFLTFVSDAGIGGTSLKEQSIANGAHLVGVILKDSSYWSDYYSFFDVKQKTVAVGENFSLTLQGRPGMSWSGEDEPNAGLSGIAVGTWKNNSFTAIEGKVTDANGSVSLSFDAAGTYYVTANGMVSGFAPIAAPICVVTVEGEKSDAELVADDKAALQVTYTPGENLTLPAAGASGKTSITWVSDKPEVISHAGVVTLPDQDTVVTMTATITCNDASDIKPFELSIPGRLSAAKTALTAESLALVEFTNAADNYYKYDSVAKDTNILTKAQSVMAAFDPDITVALADTFEAGSIIGEGGAITYPAEATAVAVPFKLTYGGSSIEHSVSVTVPKHAQTKTEEIEAMKLTVTNAMSDPLVLNGNESLDAVKTALALPGGKTSGLYITWTSSDPEVLKIASGNPSSSSGHPTGGKYGTTVTRPEIGQDAAEVTLTATFVYKTNSIMCGAGPMPESGNTISFPVKVLPVTEDEMDTIVAGASGDIRLGSKTGEVADLSAVSADLYFPSYDGYTVKWSSTLPISIPSSGYGKATITRPADGKDAIGTITLTLSKGQTVKTVTMENVKVLAWSKAELDAKRADLEKIKQDLTFDKIKKNNTSAAAVTSTLDLKQSVKVDGDTVTYYASASASAYPYKISWTVEPNDGTVTFKSSNGTGTVTRSDFNKQVTLKANISLKQPVEGVDAVETSIVITVAGLNTPASLEDLKAIMDTLAAAYDDDEDTGEWVLMDMGAYASLFTGTSTKSSDAARQTLINNAVSLCENSSAVDGDYARYILALTAQGIDPAQIYPVNSNTPYSLGEKLAAMSYTNHFNAPYILLAEQMGYVDLQDDQVKGLISLLKTNQGDNGLFGYEWGGQFFSDLDTTANAVTALASLYNTNEDAKAIVDKALTALSQAQGQEGSFGNANTDAMVIIALAAMGIDPDTDERFIKGSRSLLEDGLLYYWTLDEDGFGYDDFTTAVPLATEQGFRALVAAYGVMSTGKAYNVYDFSNNTLVPGRATGTGEVTPPEDEPSGSSEITVSVTIKGADSGDYWLNKKTVKVGQGSTVYHAFLKALDGSGITQVGAASGYVKSMTKDGETLEQFGTGPNSGWLYKVNGIRVSVGLTDCVLADGDNIVWYFTDDWTKEPGAEAFGGGAMPNKDKEKEEKPADMPQFSDFTDLNKDQWYCEAVEYVLSNGLMQGTSKDTFKPDAKLSRSMLVQILYNMKDKPEAAASLTFGDVPADGWYADAVHWAAENKLITGYSNGDFGPNDNITREQLAVILYRFAGLEKMDTAAKGDLSAFNDGDKVSSYAEDALKWAQANKIINGKPGQILDPQGTASRAEVAQILLNFSALVK